LMVPEDLAVVGFDDILLSSYFDPPLTTVKLPMHDLGAASMTMLLNLISGEKFEKSRLFKATLQVRGSTVKQSSEGKRKKC
jgi:LacI family repressor for deo operon, udp, cdd, tsx, nupC, and nupG